MERRRRFGRHAAADARDLLKFGLPRRVGLLLRQPPGFVGVPSGKEKATASVSALFKDWGIAPEY